MRRFFIVSQEDDRWFGLATLSSPLVAANPFESLHHDNGVTTDGLRRYGVVSKKDTTSSPPQEEYRTYHHAELDLLTTILLLDGIIQNNVQEDL